MKVRVNISIDSEIRDKAQKYAKAHRTSVSALVEQYLAGLTPPESEAQPLSLVEKLRGALILPTGKTPEEVLTDALEEKYLHD